MCDVQWRHMRACQGKCVPCSAPAPALPHRGTWSQSWTLMLPHGESTSAVPLCALLLNVSRPCMYWTLLSNASHINGCTQATQGVCGCQPAGHGEAGGQGLQAAAHRQAERGSAAVPGCRAGLVRWHSGCAPLVAQASIHHALRCPIHPRADAGSRGLLEQDLERLCETGHIDVCCLVHSLSCKPA